MQTRHFGAALAGLALMAASGAAVAQINPFRGIGPGMPDSDFQKMTEATDRLNTRDKPVVGGIEAWTNPATGGGGTATLTRKYKWQSMPCHTITYNLVIANMTERRDRTFVLDYCQVASGEWKIRS